MLHSKAEMNSMISSRFDSSAEAGGGPKRAGSLRKASSSAKLLAAPTKLVRAVSGLRGARVLVFGAEYLNGAHLVRYFLKVRPPSLPPSSSGFGWLFGLDGYACFFWVLNASHIPLTLLDHQPNNQQPPPRPAPPRSWPWGPGRRPRAGSSRSSAACRSWASGRSGSGPGCRPSRATWPRRSSASSPTRTSGWCRRWTWWCTRAGRSSGPWTPTWCPPTSTG